MLINRPAGPPRPRRDGRAGPDAVVIGAGPNGLVAANVLADAGWSVVVLEAAPAPGGAVASASYWGPGWTTDVCSAFYPLAAASPAVRALGLERFGLSWSRAPAVLAHPLGGDRAAVLHQGAAATAEGLDRLAAGDGRAWLGLSRLWERIGGALTDALLSPFPPVRAGSRLAAELGPGGLLRLARFAALPVRRLAEEEFIGPGPGLLLAGCALHADFSPESALGAFYGWLLAMLGQREGFPVAAGGASALAGAMVRRLESRGGIVRCGERVESIEVRAGRAVAVRTAGGERVAARHAVVADVAAPDLYGGLVRWEDLPARLVADIRRFQWDWATVKVDWALDGPVPWSAPGASEAGVVHLSPSMDALTGYSADLARGLVPAEPFVLLGQLTRSDPTRSPAGTEMVYAYTHVPRTVRADAGGDGITGRWDSAEVDSVAARMEAHIERFAPGFRALVSARHVLGPAGLEEHDANLNGGALNGGTAALHQQLVFRPVPGLGRSETPVAGLFLASASAHPGGGVHGACGANAARAAIAARRPVGRALAAAARAATERALRDPLLA